MLADRSFGDPIRELPAGRELDTPWSDVPALLARSMEARAILYGAIDEDDYTHLVWIGREDEVPEAVRGALQPWRRLLETRAEFARNAKRRWFETAWSRDKSQLRAPKVIALYRTDRGRFALDEEGAWQPSNKTTLCTAKGEGQSVAYLCGLLNSELLDLWYAVRGKRPRDVWRNYEPKPMARIPYAHVPATDVPSPPHEADAVDVIAACDAALATSPAPSVLARLLEDVVHAVGRNRQALLPFRGAAAGLGATIKDPWRTALPPIEPRALLEALAPEETASIRLDPALDVRVVSDGPLGRPTLSGSALRFCRARRTTAEVTGPLERLALIERLVGDRPRLLAADLEALLLPKDLAAFEARLEERAADIERLLDEGRELVERAERLTCRLYGVPQELEDAVVAHAVERSRRGITADGQAEQLRPAACAGA